MEIPSVVDDHHDGKRVVQKLLHIRAILKNEVSKFQRPPPKNNLKINLKKSLAQEVRQKSDISEHRSKG